MFGARKFNETFSATVRSVLHRAHLWAGASRALECESSRGRGDCRGCCCFRENPELKSPANVGAGTPAPTLTALRASGPVALLEFLRAAAWARVVATNVFQGVAHRLLVSVAAVRAVDMAVVVIMVIVIVVAVRTMDMGLLSHRCRSGIKSPGIISPLWSTRTSLPMNNPVFSSPSSR